MKVEQIDKVLREISSRIPAQLLKMVATEEDATPTVKMVMEHAMKSDTVSNEKKQQIEALYNAGEFSKKRIVENKVVAKQIDQFLAREINKAIKEGRLPKRRDIKHLEHVKQIYEKVHSESNQGQAGTKA